MDAGKKAKALFIAVFTIVCSGLSWFFTMIGASVKEMGMVPVPEMPESAWVAWVAWAAWGIMWGAICGFFGGRLLVNSLQNRRSIVVGMACCIVTAVVIGAVNGFLTNTIIFGIIEGLVLGAIGGLVFSAAFLGIFRK